MINNNTIQHLIKTENLTTDRVNDIIRSYGDIDWRDSKTVEVHSFKGSKGELVEQLNSNGFKVVYSDFRYEKTVELFFEDSYYGSYGLEDYSEEDINELLSDEDFKKKVDTLIEKSIV